MAGVLSLILRQAIATTLIVERSQISIVAVLLPLAAGAAGAINLVQSERSSLVLEPRRGCSLPRLWLRLRALSGSLLQLDAGI